MGIYTGELLHVSAVLQGSKGRREVRGGKMRRRSKSNDGMSTDGGGRSENE